MSKLEYLFGNDNNWDRNYTVGLIVTGCLVVLTLAVWAVAVEGNVGYERAFLLVIGGILGVVLGFAVGIIIVMNIGRLSVLIWTRISEWCERTE